MLTDPRLGREVQVRHRPAMAAGMPHHGRVGRVAGVGRGRPRNHAVLIGGRLVIIPCGNLRSPEPVKRPE